MGRGRVSRTGRGQSALLIKQLRHQLILGRVLGEGVSGGGKERVAISHAAKAYDKFAKGGYMGLSLPRNVLFSLVKATSWALKSWVKLG